MHPRIYEALKGKIPEMINTPEDIDRVCEYLSIDERRAVLSTMIARLPQIISSSPEGAAARWNKVFACFNDEQSQRMLLAVQERLPSMLNTENDLFCFIEHLGQDNCGIIIDALARKDKGTFPKQAFFHDLGKLSYKLTSEQFTKALGAIQMHRNLPLGGSVRSFILPDALPLIERSKWITVLTIVWPFVARSSFVVHDSQNKGFKGLFKSIRSFNLSPEEFTVLFRGLGPGMCSPIYLASDLLKLPATQRADALIAIANTDPLLLKSVKDYGNLLVGLPNQDVVKTIHALSGLKISNELHLLRAFLSAPRRPADLTNVLSNILSYIAPLLKTKTDLQTIGAYFNPQARDSNRYYQLFSKVFAIEDYPVGFDDRKLSAYVADAKTRIRDLESPGVFDALNEEFSAVLRSVASPEVRAVKQYIEQLRHKKDRCTTIFKNDCTEKAHEIERALCDIDPQNRGTVVTGGPNPVTTAITTGRISKKVNPVGLVKVEQILAQLRNAETLVRAPGTDRPAH